MANLVWPTVNMRSRKHGFDWLACWQPSEFWIRAIIVFVGQVRGDRLLIQESLIAFQLRSCRHDSFETRNTIAVTAVVGR